MAFVKTGKTNWKYILIVLILVLLVGGGILWLVKTQEVPFIESEEFSIITQKTENKEKIVFKIIDELSTNLSTESRNSIIYKIDDLDGNDEPELILFVPDFDKDIYKLYVFTIFSEKGNYKKIGETNIEGSNGLIIKEIKDIDGDGVKDIYTQPAIWGGTSLSHHDSIISANFNIPGINFVKAKTFEGELIDQFKFMGGGGQCVYEGWIFGKDFDNNGKKEIINLKAHPNVSEICNYFNKNDSEDTCHKCKLSVYQWSGLVFIYNKELSEKAKDKIDIREFPLAECQICIWESE